MIASEELTRDLTTHVPRPSGRTMVLPHGSSALDRNALLQALVEGLLEIRAWPSAGEIGDSSHLILDTQVGGQAFYAQFLSEPRERGLLCEIASGFFGNAAAYHATPEQGRAMVSRGFSDGLAGNFRKDLVFDAPDAAKTIADQTLSLLDSVFGWIPTSPITAKIHHGRRADTALIFDGLSRENMIELLTRHGLEARLTPAGGAAPHDATVEAASRGSRFTVHFANPVEQTSRFRSVAVRAHVGSGIDVAATNPFNGLTALGRSWVQDGDAYVEASLRIVGVTEEALHQWVEQWSVVLATARYWYRRVERGGEESLALQPVHFGASFHNVQRMARSHVKPAAEETAHGAFAEYCRSPNHAQSADGVDAWAFFEGYAAAHPDQAMPVEGKFVSRASAADIVPWLERLDGIQATVTSSGDLEICHAIGETLLLSPAAIRRVALSPERFALSATIEGAGGCLRDVQIGTDGFYLPTDEGRIELEGSTFIVDDMAATIPWFQTKERLRRLEREIATVGPFACGADLACVHGALAGAERVGLMCGAERARFDGVIAAARRSLIATRAANRGPERTTPLLYGDVDIETLRRRHDVPREEARALGNATVQIIEHHGYKNLRGNAVDLRRLVEAARQGTVEYGPEDPVPPPSTASRPSTAHITVRNTSTLAAAHGLLRDGYAPAALNFASPTHPGGGFLSGARAQEEYLARSSALYACLHGRRMYSHCEGRKDPFLAEFVIVSPEVPVFRDDDGLLLDEPWCCTILTAPAVQAHGVHRYLPRRSGEIEPVMRARIHRVLSVAAAHGLRALVLGGWGCGAFGNDPVMIARLFREALAGEIGHHFDEVVFAVTDWSDERRFVGPFERAFAIPTAMTASEARVVDDELIWCEGSESPTGRRVLDVRAGRRQLVSWSSDPKEAFCSVNAPNNISELLSHSPADAEDSAIDWTFDAAEIGRICAGFEPSAMDDKWRIIARDKGLGLCVYFLRSWTNTLIFVLDIKNGRPQRLVHPKTQFAPTQTARAILDGYLLERVCVIPAPRALGTDKRGLMSYGWSVAGRRCDFVEPEA